MNDAALLGYENILWIKGGLLYESYRRSNRFAPPQRDRPETPLAKKVLKSRHLERHRPGSSSIEDTKKSRDAAIPR